LTSELLCMSPMYFEFLLLSFFLVYLYNFTNITYNFFFFFNDTATTKIYTLSLHDALPIYFSPGAAEAVPTVNLDCTDAGLHQSEDRKSTRLNSSHGSISYAVFCLKKKRNSKP